MKGPFTLLVPFFALVVLCHPDLRAQDAADTPLPSTNDAATPASPADLSAAIAQKEAEIAQLKKQLAQAKGEIQNLHTKNQKLQEAAEAAPTPQNPAPGVAPAPIRPAPSTLTSTPETPLNSLDLFWYFHNSADSANQYLKDKEIAVTGKIVGFQAPMVIRIFGVELESGDPNLRVTCKFGIPQIYATVFFRRATGEIIGRTTGGTEDVLLNMNQSITIAGKCHGLDDGDVAMTSCRLIL